MDYKIFNVRTWSFVFVRQYTRGNWAQQLDLEKVFFLVLLVTGFEFGSLMSWHPESDALPTEPPRYPCDVQSNGWKQTRRGPQRMPCGYSWAWTCKHRGIHTTVNTNDQILKRIRNCCMATAALRAKSQVTTLPPQACSPVHWHQGLDLVPGVNCLASPTAPRALSFLLKAYSPANHTGSPRGFYQTCTLHKHKAYKQNPKVSPFGIALIKNGNKVRRCWYHWPFRSGV